MGNFNMIDNVSDQCGGIGQVVNGHEARAWTSLNHKFRMRDMFIHQQGHLRYNWDNHKNHRHNPLRHGAVESEGQILRRLDRIYGPQASNSFNLALSSLILPGLTLSDHAPVIATIRKGEVRKRPSCHRLNSAHLKSPAFLERMQTMWAEHVGWAVQKGWDPGRTLAFCLKGAGRVDHCWGERKVMERRRLRDCKPDF